MTRSGKDRKLRRKRRKEMACFGSIMVQMYHKKLSEWTNANLAYAGKLSDPVEDSKELTNGLSVSWKKADA